MILGGTNGNSSNNSTSIISGRGVGGTISNTSTINGNNRARR
jgi:hypothetical protein